MLGRWVLQEEDLTRAEMGFYHWFSMTLQNTNYYHQHIIIRNSLDYVKSYVYIIK